MVFLSLEKFPLSQSIRHMALCGHNFLKCILGSQGQSSTQSIPFGKYDMPCQWWFGRRYQIKISFNGNSDCGLVGAIVEECLAPCTYFVKKKKKIVDFAEKSTGALWPLQKALFLSSIPNTRDFNKGRHPAICRRSKRVKSPVRLLETKIFVH